MVVWVPDWPVNCLVVDLPVGQAGAVTHADRIEVANAAARGHGVRAGMRTREAAYLCPELTCLPRNRDEEARAFSQVVDVFDGIAAGVECLRPGLARCPAQGPSRWVGSEEGAALALIDAIEEALGVECFVGIADGTLASLEAARQGRIVGSEDAEAFRGTIALSRTLSCLPTPMRERGIATIKLLAELGVTSCADLWAIGHGPVLERFGDVGEALWVLASGGDTVTGTSGRIQPDVTAEIAIEAGGDRIDTMIVPITQCATDLSRQLGESALVSQTLRIDVEDSAGGRRNRTWSGCDLSCPQESALRVRWTLTGWVSGNDGPSGEVRFLRLSACSPQLGGCTSALWGRQQREQDILRAAVRIQGMAGANALLVPHVQGGYDPRSRVVLAPWGSQVTLKPRSGGWDGGVTTPPATLFDVPPKVRVLAGGGTLEDVRVDPRGALSATPAYLLDGAPRPRNRGRGEASAGSRVSIREVGGPWLVGGRWWAGEHPRAYMRVWLEDGRDALLVWEEGEWAMEGLAP